MTGVAGLSVSGHHDVLSTRGQSIGGAHYDPDSQFLASLASLGQSPGWGRCPGGPARWGGRRRYCNGTPGQTPIWFDSIAGAKPGRRRRRRPGFEPAMSQWFIRAGIPCNQHMSIHITLGGVGAGPGELSPGLHKPTRTPHTDWLSRGQERTDAFTMGSASHLAPARTIYPGSIVSRRDCGGGGGGCDADVPGSWKGQSARVITAARGFCPSCHKIPISAGDAPQQTICPAGRLSFCVLYEHGPQSAFYPQFSFHEKS